MQEQSLAIFTFCLLSVIAIGAFLAWSTAKENYAILKLWILILCMDTCSLRLKKSWKT